MWQTWLIIAGICFIIEIMTTGFLIFWFSIGAIIAMISSFFIDSIIIQSTIFLIFSTILLFATKPFTEKFQSKEPTYKSNSNSLEGKKAKTIMNINSIEGTGQIKINGEVWSAKTADGTDIPSGTDVTIEKVEGVKVIVKPIK